MTITGLDRPLALRTLAILFPPGIGTGTFTPGQFRSVALFLTAIGHGMRLLFAPTWWRWLGWLRQTVRC